MAWNADGQPDKAAAHLERCPDLDPMPLPAGEAVSVDIDHVDAGGPQGEAFLRHLPPGLGPALRRHNRIPPCATCI
jgi:hypothetical protein